tara:strand:- start:1865 stop:2074 length:210 start_codon:yes stop_codon:yes gene_type:complete
VKPQAESGAVVPVPASDNVEVETLEPFGELIPFADPAWYQGVRFPSNLSIHTSIPGGIKAQRGDLRTSS